MRAASGFVGKDSRAFVEEQVGALLQHVFFVDLPWIKGIIVQQPAVAIVARIRNVVSFFGFPHLHHETPQYVGVIGVRRVRCGKVNHVFDLIESACVLVEDPTLQLYQQDAGPAMDLDLLRRSTYHTAICICAFIIMGTGFFGQVGEEKLVKCVDMWPQT